MTEIVTIEGNLYPELRTEDVEISVFCDRLVFWTGYDAHAEFKMEDLPALRDYIDLIIGLHK